MPRCLMADDEAVTEAPSEAEQEGIAAYERALAETVSLDWLSRSNRLLQIAIEATK